MTSPKRWLAVVTTFLTTFVLALFAFLLVPIVTGMAGSGGAAGTKPFRFVGLDVFTVTTDGNGGFASTFGPGVILLPVALGVLMGAASMVAVLRNRPGS